MPLELPGLLAYKVSKDTGIFSMTLSEILRGKRDVTPKNRDSIVSKVR